MSLSVNCVIHVSQVQLDTAMLFVSVVVVYGFRQLLHGVGLQLQLSDLLCVQIS